MSKAGLSVVSLEMKEFPGAQKKVWEESGDAKLAARAAANDVRAWSNTWLMAGTQISHMLLQCYSMHARL